METGEIISYIAAIFGGGGLATIVNWRFNRKKNAIDIRVNEIEAIHQTVEKVYQPIINQQNLRIQELEAEVKSLRDTLSQERLDHQKQIDTLQKQIVEITRVLGIKAQKQLRDEKTGRYIKVDGE